MVKLACLHGPANGESEMQSTELSRPYEPIPDQDVPAPEPEREPTERDPSDPLWPLPADPWPDPTPPVPDPEPAFPEP